VEILTKAVLSLDAQDLAIEIAVFIEIAAQMLHVLPGIVRCGKDRQELAGEDPVDQIILIAEMIIEAFSVHLALGADVTDTDFGKRFFLQFLFKRGGHRLFGNNGICHVQHSFLRIKKDLSAYDADKSCRFR
jgi:hypothetical protein